MTLIYVVSFAPDATDTAGVGGFEWRRTKPEAVEWLVKELVHNPDDSFDYLLRATTIPVPAFGPLAPPLTDPNDAEIQTYLEQNPEVWDVPCELNDPRLG